MRLCKQDIIEFYDLYSTLDYEHLNIYIISGQENTFGDYIWRCQRRDRFGKHGWINQEDTEFNVTFTGIAIADYYEENEHILDDEGPSSFVERAKEESDLICNDCKIEGEYSGSIEDVTFTFCPNCHEEWTYEL